MNFPADLTERFFVHNGQLLPTTNFTDSMVEGETVVYEVVRVAGSTPIFAIEHLLRLQASIKNSNLPALANNSAASSLRILTEKNPVAEKNVRITYSVSTNHPVRNLTVYYIPSRYPTRIEKQKGVVLECIDAERPNPTVKVENKSLRELTNEIIESHGCYEVLLVNAQGEITEGSRSNVFFISRDRLFTAPETKVLSGITRQKVVQICHSLNVELVERCIGIKELAFMDGCFLTGTSPGVLPVRQVGNVSMNASIPVINAISMEYERLVEKSKAEWHSFTGSSK